MVAPDRRGGDDDGDFVPLLALPASRADQDFLDEAAANPRQDRYELFDRYYRGDHRVLLRDRIRKFLERSGVPFAENYCDLLVDVVSDRLKVVGFDTSMAVETGDGPKDPLSELLGEWWQRARMDAVQGRVHNGAVRLGDYFVIVDYDDERRLPRFVPNHPSGVKVVYSDDNPDEKLYAAKTWETMAVGPSNPAGLHVERLNVYLPDRVDKWFRPASTQSGGWQPWLNDDGEFSLAWTTGSGEPLGVPVFHFRYKPLDSVYGVSRLADAIPFQDELNKLIVDLNELTDNHALPQRWATGIPGTSSYKSVAGNVWSAAAAEAKFGQFDVADTGQLLNTVEGLLSRLARKTRTPMHLLTGGTPPSGESLKTSEVGLLALVEACQTGFGNTWEDAVLFAVRLAQDAGQLEQEAPDDAWVETQWDNPEIRSDEDDLQAALLKQRLGVSEHTLIGELGYDAGREAELSAAERDAKAEAQARLFDAGGIGG